jgi:hypothetical protein
VLFGRAVLRLSGPGVEHEYASVEVAAGHAADKAGVAGSDLDSQLFSHLTSERVEGRLALLNVTSRHVPAIRCPQPRPVPVHEQDSVCSHENAAHDVVEGTGNLDHSSTYSLASDAVAISGHPSSLVLGASLERERRQWRCSVYRAVAVGTGTGSSAALCRVTWL